MKKILFTALLALLATGVGAQEQQKEEGYRFTDVKTLPVTSVKNQNRSGTCWAYSALAFLESEILRNGGGEYDLSAMWIVRNAYFEKAVKYARMHGSLNLAVGGGSRDVTDGIKKYGIVPTEVYPGLCYGTDLPDFTEIDRVVMGYMDAVIAGDKLTTAWQRGLDAVLDAYLGPKPEKFTWKGKEYTPQSFAASLGLDMDDYVEISSYTHHPFYEEFILEVPDNWMWGTVWNLPLDEMMAVVDNALANDYTVLWGTDVSEKGFSRTKAIGIVPEADLTSMSGTDAERWGKLSDKEKEAALYKFDKPGKERVITQQMRQEAFDNYETTDDHGMQIMGTAVDQAGNDYYKVKNSWGVRPPYDGYYYFSRPFVAYKTMSVMVNKKAIPAPIRKKMGL